MALFEKSFFFQLLCSFIIKLKYFATPIVSYNTIEIGDNIVTL